MRTRDEIEKNLEPVLRNDVSDEQAVNVMIVVQTEVLLDIRDLLQESTRHKEGNNN